MIPVEQMTVIAGDSWACGEWQRTSKGMEITHWGVGKYIQENKKDLIPFGVSKVGGSNLEVLKLLENGYTKADKIIFILTEPFRDFEFSPERYDPTKSFLENCNNTIQHTLEKLRKIQDLGPKIILVNGLHELQPQDYFYEHVSWCKLLNLESVVWPLYYAHHGRIKSLFLDQKKIKIDKQSVVYELPDDERNQEQFWNNMENNRNLFYPDGTHPNRFAHKILYDRIEGLL